MANITYGSPVVSGSVEVTATVASSKRTVATGYATPNNTTTTVYTVPAGKVARIVGLACSIGGNFTSGNYHCNVQLNNVVFISAFVAGSTYTPVQRQSISFNYENAPVITAGQTIRVGNTTGNSGYGQAWWVEEDA